TRSKRDWSSDVCSSDLINPTNICNKFCKFCAFYRTSKDDDGYSLSLEQIQARVREKLHEPITEIHMVGGVNPDLPFEFYLDMIRSEERRVGKEGRCRWW